MAKAWQNRWSIEVELPQVAPIVLQLMEGEEGNPEFLWGPIFKKLGKISELSQIRDYPTISQFKSAIGKEPTVIILDELESWYEAIADPVRKTRNLNFIWTSDGSGDLDAFYAQQERETNHLEEFIRDTYFEFYDALLERTKSQDRAAHFASLDASIVVLDGLSIREANWLMPRLIEKGYEITGYSYAFSGMPSTTQTFFREVFGVAGAGAMPKKWHGFNFRSIRAGDVPAFLDGPKALVWLSFPDKLMHPMRGKGVTPSFALQRTEEALLKILNLLETPEVILTSDHGYIYAQSAAFFWHAPVSNRKVLLKLFGAQRGLPADSTKAQEFEGLRALPKDQTYVLFDNKGCYVRGRYYWSAPGKQSDVAHGGISLMECLVPVIRLRRG